MTHPTKKCFVRENEIQRSERVNETRASTSANKDFASTVLEESAPGVYDNANFPSINSTYEIPDVSGEQTQPYETVLHNAYETIDEDGQYEIPNEDENLHIYSN